MAASEGSYIGLAKQTAKGTPNVTDASFVYMLLTEGAIAPNGLTVPLDREVGGGSLLRSMIQGGVFSAGKLAFIPRPASLGHLLLGAIGSVTSTQNGAGTSYTHVFKMASDNFSLPWYTWREGPGMIWGEQFQDVRVGGLSVAWRGGRFVTAEAQLVGGLPAKVSTATWSPAAKVDGGPQLLATIGAIEVPAATAMKVIGGSFSIVNAMPLDEQWIVGSYVPDNFDITQRAFVLNLVAKVVDATLYSKMMYDPAGGSAWVASMYKEGNILVDLKSDVLAATVPSNIPYELKIQANGQTGDNSNVFWDCQPIALKAGRQLLLNITGTYVADPAGTNDPLVVTLINKQTSY
jgi:hypothetical protein